MKRTARDRTYDAPRPVIRAQLSAEHFSLRAALAVLFGILAALAFTWGFNALLSVGDGWQEIKVNASAETNCGDDFVFRYELGASGLSAPAENKQLTRLYSDAMVAAYQQFNTDQPFDGVVNLYTINHSPNQTLTVPDPLYSALARVAASGDRTLYLAPAADVYDNLFYCQTDSDAALYDPARSPELAALFAEYAAFARDENAVQLRLLGNNQLRLEVSQQYLDYAAANSIEDFLDFAWMKNAFIVDYLADLLIANGYTRGILASQDGFTRCLGASAGPCSLNLYARRGQTVYAAAVMDYAGPLALVTLHDYPLVPTDLRRFYEYEDGTTAAIYLSVLDGKSRVACHDLTGYSAQAGCSDVLLRLVPLYLADTLDTGALYELPAAGIDCIWYEDTALLHTAQALSLRDLYEGDGVRFTARLAA